MSLCFQPDYFLLDKLDALKFVLPLRSEVWSQTSHLPSKHLSLYRLGQYRRFPGGWSSPEFLENTMMARFSVSRTVRICLQEIFLLESERIKSMKNPNGPTGNRTREFPAYSAVAQPTAQPHTHTYLASSINMFHKLRRPKREAYHRCPSVVEIISVWALRAVCLPGAVRGHKDILRMLCCGEMKWNHSLSETLYQLPSWR